VLLACDWRQETLHRDDDVEQEVCIERLQELQNVWELLRLCDGHEAGVCVYYCRTYRTLLFLFCCGVGSVADNLRRGY